MAPLLVLALLLASPGDPPLPVLGVKSVEGAYRWEEGGFVDIMTWNELGPGALVAFDDAGWVRALTPAGPGAFTAGRTVAIPEPVAARVRFETSAAGAPAHSLVWEAEGRPPKTAGRVRDHRAEEAAITGAGATLAGTLMLPATPGPHPALVLLHGSNAQDRNGTLPFARFLLRHGIAILACDKRGVGASGGEWRTASFDTLAGDALAAVAWLKTRREIDPKRIGLFGASQGGWIGPLAASRSRDVALVVSVSGPGVTPAEQTLDLIEAELRLSGASDDEVKEALALTNLAFDYGRTGEAWDAFAAALARSQERAWLPYLPLAAEPGAAIWEQQRLFYHHDPEPALRALRCPVLAIFGEKDLGVPALKNRERWRAALKRKERRGNSLVILPGADHVMFGAKSGSLFEIADLDGFVPGYRPVVLDWLRRRFGLR